MDHRDAILKVGKRLKVQPLDQLLAIRRAENVFEVVIAARLASAA